MKLAFRRFRSRWRRASAPTILPTRDHSAPITTATARTSSTIQGQLTLRVYPGETGATVARMARISRLLLAAAAAALALPALAHAEERTLTFTTPAISVEGYGVAQQPMPAESPKVDGYVVGMEAEVVDAQGRVQGRDKVMLHHIVFAKVGVPDYTCGGAASASSPRARSGSRSRCRAATATRTRRPTAGACSTC